MESSTTKKQVTSVSTQNDNFELLPLPPLQEKSECGTSKHPDTEEILIDSSEGNENTNENIQGTIILLWAKFFIYNIIYYLDIK